MDLDEKKDRVGVMMYVFGSTSVDNCSGFSLDELEGNSEGATRYFQD